MAAWEQRFESKVDRSADCHLWTGAKTPSGVGQIRIDGKLRTAAQVAWELAHGPLPAASRIQSCPVHKLCIRVDHLTLDTPQTAHLSAFAVMQVAVMSEFRQLEADRAVGK